VRVTAGVAMVAIVLALLFLPARARAARLAAAQGATTGHVTVT
jgi:hypothetical protein